MNNNTETNPSEETPTPQRSREAALQAERAARGLCRTHANRPAIGKTQYCQDCRESRRARALERYHKQTRGKTRPFRCGKCGEYGHNKRTCNGPNKVQSNKPETNQTKNQKPKTQDQK